MPVQDVRVIEMPVRGDVSELEGGFRDDVRFEGREAAARPAAVDAVRWGATLMTQLGLDPRATDTKRPAA
jgi:hypothetical protein